MNNNIEQELTKGGESSDVAKGAVVAIPSGTIIKIEGIPFLTIAETIVGGEQENLDLALRVANEPRTNGAIA